MAKIISTATGDLALTFDDVLLQPAESSVMPADVDIRTHVTKDIALKSANSFLSYGHRDRSQNGDCLGTSGRHGRNPP